MADRRADKAGSWYRGNAAALAAEVDACLEAARRAYGPPPAGKIPTAAVAPHAGLAYSGPVAATVFAAIRAAYASVDTFVVFGACHRARLRTPAIWPDGVWETPLGSIAVDAALAERFVAGGVGAADTRPHAEDNAIELLTPFIKRLFPEAKIVPVAMSPQSDSWRRGAQAAALAAETGAAVIAVASTDLTHYGAAFGVLPAGIGAPALEWARRNDARFLDVLTRLDLDAIVPTAERDGSACGGGAAAAAAGWAKARGCTGGQTLAYATSHDSDPDGPADHFVGYAAVAYALPE